MHFQPIENVNEDNHMAQGQQGYQVDVSDAAAPNDALDDVFGSGPPSPTADAAVHPHQESTSRNAHPSDMHRLQTEHATTGYREGVTAAKETSLQAGFDEGFGLGASVGLRAGQLLGILEAIAEAVRSSGSSSEQDTDAARAIKLNAAASEELSVASVFKPEYWAEDGNWKFEVTPVGGGDGEVVFADVANAHPVIKKWAAIVDEQVSLWKIDRSILDDETGPRLESVMDEPIVPSAPPTASKPLDW